MHVHVCSHVWFKHTPLDICEARVTMTCPPWSLLFSWIMYINPYHLSGGLNSLKQSYNCIFSIIRYLITWLNVLDQAACVNNDDLVSHALLLGFQKAHQLANRRRKMFFSFLHWVWQAETAESYVLLGKPTGWWGQQEVAGDLCSLRYQFKASGRACQVRTFSACILKTDRSTSPQDILRGGWSDPETMKSPG